eukprot:236437-Chlamydomonas_euryale.AAC.1
MPRPGAEDTAEEDDQGGGGWCDLRGRHRCWLGRTSKRNGSMSEWWKSWVAGRRIGFGAASGHWRARDSQMVQRADTGGRGTHK